MKSNEAGADLNFKLKATGRRAADVMYSKAGLQGRL